MYLLTETEGLPTENVFGDKVGFVCIEYRVPYWLALTIPLPLPYILSLPPILGIVPDCVTAIGLPVILSFLSLRCVHMASTHSFISKLNKVHKHTCIHVNLSNVFVFAFVCVCVCVYECILIVCSVLLLFAA